MKSDASRKPDSDTAPPANLSLNNDPRRLISEAALNGEPLSPRGPPICKRYKMTIAYDGAKFHGWQKQVPPDGTKVRTVAGTIEDQLQRLFKHPITLVGASRTDQGVNVRGQVAHFDATTHIPDGRVVLAINSRMPDDIDVLSAEAVPMSFHSIRDAVNKQYRYRIFNSQRRPLERRNVVYRCWWPIDIDRMNDAARRLVGTHDFAGFAAANHGRATTVRTIFDCHVEAAPDDEIHVVVSGSGFLYNMVRIIAGTLLDVGRSKYDASIVDQALATADRSHAGATLPPQGLVLEWVKYE